MATSCLNPSLHRTNILTIKAEEVYTLNAQNLSRGIFSSNHLQLQTKSLSFLSKEVRSSDQLNLLPPNASTWSSRRNGFFHLNPCLAIKNSENEVISLSDEAEQSSLVGEDAAVFDISNQKVKSWVNFFLVLGTVMTALYFIWIDPEIGYGTPFINSISSISDVSEVRMIAILFVFALVHSGGAALRFSAEKLIGERAYRVLFAGISLPLAVSSVVYFINHRYDGVQLWQITGVTGVHDLVWFLSFVSFFFLYPSTFNLLEVAAVDKPKFHMWETGIMRITRHPQMVGQLIWCVAHMLWIGNTFTLVTSLGLLAHHSFGVWHGDKRLSERYGEAFEAVKSRTSIVPFKAIVEGRQILPKDYYREFLRAPYIAIVFVTIGAYFCHPLMQQASYWLKW